MTMLLNVKFKDLLPGFFDSFSWWIHFNLIFAMQVSEKNNIIWNVIIQSNQCNGEHMGCTWIVLYIIWVVSVFTIFSGGVVSHVHVYEQYW